MVEVLPATTNAAAPTFMNDNRRVIDIFVAGGPQHVAQLKALLPKLHAYGTVHLASSFLTSVELAQLQGQFDVLHQPHHSSDGYHNFELFSIRDINKIARAPYFVKLDADTHIEPDWIDYVEACITAHPDTVLFGPRKGNVDISLQISGRVVQEKLSREISVRDVTKVIGGFYVGKTSFFKDHLRFMDLVHEFLWCYEEGVRRRPSPNPQYWLDDTPALQEPITVLGNRNKNFKGNEDTLRSLVVHAVGAGNRLDVFDSGGRIRIDRPGTMFP
ncbi:MAG TPA: hypothetical protein VLL54_20645 [Pyrinomonadaceae bacterium]|nr:hypothetical protein [Pyrinomonadaceae bacterium]